MGQLGEEEHMGREKLSRREGGAVEGTWRLGREGGRREGGLGLLLEPAEEAICPQAL